MHENETAGDFVPPDPPPIKVTDPITAAALAGVIGAPLVFVIVGILLTYEPVRLGSLCVAVFVASFLVLFFRSSSDRAPRDSGWDDGSAL
jgi:hypothetical protein